MRGLLGASLCGALLGASPARPAVEASDPSEQLIEQVSDQLSDQARSRPYAAFWEYADQLRPAWKRFEEPNLAHMHAWFSANAPASSSTVFYPFSGPDIANALAAFPDADTYLMFGLEPPGALPDPHAIDDDALASNVDELQKSLRDVLQVNYFFTRAMEKRLGTGPVNSVTGLLVLFLAMSDCEVTNARELADAGVPGVEITFRRHGGKDQTIRYFQANVADAALAKSSPELVPYLERQGRFVTMIKSASYILHKEHFDTIRSLILDHSDVVVQDDSGVPLKDFARDTWKVAFHGRYAAPTPEFRTYLQKDLRAEMQRGSTGRLPFSYGYAYKQGESNLMIAERRQ